MAKILSTVACNLDAHILRACLPLFQEERVGAIEWSFDALFQIKQMPDWFEELLHTYGSANRLIGHGVFFSLFSGKWLPEQQHWLDTLRQTRQRFPLEQVTEHFGFMTGSNFHDGAPLAIPYSASTLRIGRDRLQRIQNAAQCPVGLENLAFAYSVEEVRRHGDFLAELIEPVNGFIILDLHNMYCQAENFQLSATEMLQLYPLDRVREIHISGGSWEEVSIEPGRRVRRDTHDDGVPNEVFDLLHAALQVCPHCKYVVLEQLGVGLHTPESRAQFYADFIRMEKTVDEANLRGNSTEPNNFIPAQNIISEPAIEDDRLFQQQRELSAILESDMNYEEALSALRASSLAGTEWNIEHWDPAMLETAMQIAQKWANTGKRLNKQH
jgi:uncharacterized protein (UPF0276 family)